jgi:hypothetical protein
MPIDNFPDPFISCCFVDDDIIFVNLFHNRSCKHHHFFFSISTRKLSYKKEIKLNCNSKNFPLKCFYNEQYNEIYTFYRQGDSLIIPCDGLDIKKLSDSPIKMTTKISAKDEQIDKREIVFQDIWDKDLG